MTTRSKIPAIGSSFLALLFSLILIASCSKSSVSPDTDGTAGMGTGGLVNGGLTRNGDSDVGQIIPVPGEPILVSRLISAQLVGKFAGSVLVVGAEGAVQAAGDVRIDAEAGCVCAVIVDVNGFATPNSRCSTLADDGSFRISLPFSASTKDTVSVWTGNQYDMCRDGVAVGANAVSKKIVVYRTQFPSQVTAIGRFKDKLALASDNGLYLLDLKAASDPDVPLSEVFSERYTMGDALPSNEITQIGTFDDDSDTLWVATSKGVCRMDLTPGRSPNCFNLLLGDSGGGLEWVTAIEPRRGTDDLWVGTNTGLFLVENAKGTRSNIHIRQFHASDNPLCGLVNDPVRLLMDDGSTGVWVGTNSEVSGETFGGLTHIAPVVNEKDSSCPQKGPFSFQQIPQNTIWFLGGEFIWAKPRLCRDPDMCSLPILDAPSIQQANGIVGRTVTGLFSTSGGGFYASTELGFTRIRSNGTFEFWKNLWIDKQQSKVPVSVLDLTKDDLGNYFVEINGGLAFLSMEGWNEIPTVHRMYKVNDIGQPVPIYKTRLDAPIFGYSWSKPNAGRMTGIWVGDDILTYYFFNNSRYAGERKLEVTDGLLSNHIQAVSPGSDGGDLWVGTGDAGASHMTPSQDSDGFDYKNFTANELYKDLAPGRALSVHEVRPGPAGGAWLRSGGDVFLAPGGRNVFHNGSASWLSIASDGADGLWIGDPLKGILFYDSKLKCTIYPQVHVTRSSPDPGQCPLDPANPSGRRASIYDPAESVGLSGVVTNVDFDTVSGALWVGTQGGLSRVTRKANGYYRFENFTVDSGHLPVPYVRFAQADGKRGAWAVSMAMDSRGRPTLGYVTHIERSADGAYTAQSFNACDYLVSDQATKDLCRNTTLAPTAFAVKKGTHPALFVGGVGGLLVTTISDNGAPVSRFFTTPDGLPDNQINDITITADGLAWLATSNGLVAF
ncbi:MAG: hypothetical protein V1798_08740 [Pseudomonadota bacterium]